jgi:hypothetical protein
LKGAPATFHRLMNTVLSGVQGIRCLVYMDDIVAFGENLKTQRETQRSPGQDEEIQLEITARYV